MTNRMPSLALVILVLALPASHLWAGQNKTIAYPVGYRKWTHVKSALVGPASPAYKKYGGLHHIYANEQALEGYRSGKFPDGSVLVFDLLEANESQGTTTGEMRKFIDVMLKDSQRFAASGGWGFEEFRGDSQTERVLTAEDTAKCFACHAQKKENDSVFSVYRK